MKDQIDNLYSIKIENSCSERHYHDNEKTERDHQEDEKTIQSLGRDTWRKHLC